MKQEVIVELAGGKRLTFETGRMAKQAPGAALVSQGDSVVLATAVASPEPKEGIDFFPLTVDYREYAYAGGRIPGGFIKREGRPSEKEILTSRQIDRPIRPLFPENFRNETQVIALVFSADKENDPDVVGINAASAALALSDIPFNGPVGAVRVGYLGGEYLINPTYAERKESSISITVVGTADGIVMIESGATGVAEDIVLGAIDFAHIEIKKIVAKIHELVGLAGKPKRQLGPIEHDEQYFSTLQGKVGQRLKDALDTHTHAKTESYAMVKAIKDELQAEVKQLPEAEQSAAKKKLSHYYELLREQTFRQQVTKDRVRPDRRAFDQIRPISIETSVLPRTHGSALFTRGETQALVTCTLGTGDDAQRLETFEGEQKKKFMLHYNFPPFSVGETGRMTGTGRREIGHGALAERAIAAVLPSEADSPYAYRIVSDILESNGSSSMASVCGASLALMDAGIALKGSVAGIAMGLVKEGDDYAILTDIAGAEDHYGDMDFKVAGTREGITALQMDIKIGGITSAIMREAMEQARRGRLFLLDTMDAHLAEAREAKSKHAPQIRTLQIPVDKIRDLIGPGGKVIRGIIEQTGVKIDVEDTGRVNVASSDADGLAKALEIIGNLTAVPEIGKTYRGKVVRLAEFGAFVELFPGTDGLLHVSEIAEHRVKDVKDELNEGDQVMVKVIGLEGNRIKLSRKALLKEQREKQGLPLPAAAEGGRSEGRSEGGREGRSEGGRGERSEGRREGGREGGRERGDAQGDRLSASAPASRDAQPSFAPPVSATSMEGNGTITIEGGEEFEDFDGADEGEEGEEPNFNREGAPVEAPAGGVLAGAAAGAGQRRRRGRGRGGRPGGPARGPGQGGGNRA